MSDNGSNLRLGVDVGGTFTDLVALSEGGLTTAKVPSTPRDQSAGVMNAIEMLEVESGAVYPHSRDDGGYKRPAGTSRHPDSARDNRGVQRRAGDSAPESPLPLRPGPKPPSPLIPCELRFTVKERMGPAGEVEALDEASIKETVSAIKESKVEAVAVCLIGGGAGPLISIYLVGATGGSYWPVVAWMVLLCIITFVSVLVAAQTYQGGKFATEQSGAASDHRRARLGG